MPNPKAGTVTPDLESAVKEIAAGKFEFRTDKHGNIHTIFGKLSFGKEKLVENLNFFLNLINEIKPTGAKAVYINSVFICDAMGPSIQLDMTSDNK
jgi:large subunit ribosomal protein L1